MSIKEGEQFHDGMMLSVVSEWEDTGTSMTSDAVGRRSGLCKKRLRNIIGSVLVVTTVAFVESVLLLSVSYEKKHRSTDSEDRTPVPSQDEK